MAGTDAVLGEVFFQKMKEHQSLIAQFIDGTNESQTYGDVLKKSVRVALALRDKNGIKSGDVIGLCSDPNKDALLPFIAGLRKLIKNLQPKVLFVSENCTELIEDCLQQSEISIDLVIFGKSDKHIEFDEYLKPHPEEEIFKPLKGIDNKETAVILFSSGTTGEPKGICLSHYTFLKQSTSDAILVSSEQEDMQEIYLTKGGLNWVAEIVILIKSIIKGSTRIIWNMDRKKAWTLIEKYKVTYAFLCPYLAAEIATSRPEKVDTSSLKVFLTGGYAVTTKFMEVMKKALPGTFVTQVYGQTEAGGITTLFIPTNEKHIQLQEQNPTSCGIMLDEYQWKVVDIETDQRLGPNQSGELRVKSDSLMKGYYKMDSFSLFDSEGYLKTGDLVYYDSNNCIYVKGRLREMFKYKSYQIMPTALEEILMQHPSVKEALVIGIPHEKDSNHAMGLVVLKDENDKVSCEDIEKFVEKRVYEIQRLRAGVKIVKELLKNFSGKYQRRTIRNEVLQKMGIVDDTNECIML